MSATAEKDSFYLAPDMSHAFLELFSVLAFINKDLPVSELHTQGLESKYGTVSAHVLQHAEAIRIVDIVDKSGTCRTHAITWFPPTKSGELQPIYEEIAAGGLIGKTLQKYGYRKVNIPIADGVVLLPPSLRKRFAVEQELACFSLYTFLATNSQASLVFGVIAEIYSPDYQKVLRVEPHTDLHIAPSSAAPFIQALHDYLDTYQE